MQIEYLRQSSIQSGDHVPKFSLENEIIAFSDAELGVRDRERREQ